MPQESLKIESKDLSIEDLYKDFYTVPDFQREYIWKEEHIEKLLQDVQDEFYDEDGRVIPGPEYFLGSIVVCRSPDGTLSLIDGQQRMTTIFLILCVIRDLIREMGEKPNNALEGQISASSNNDVGEEVFRHRLVLQYEDSRGILRKVVETPEILDKVTDKTTSVQRIRTAYTTILEILRINYLDCEKSTARLKHFYAIFTQRVKLIRIITPSLTNALKVFETVNDRGVGLNAMDLLKNLLFMKTEEEDYPRLKVLWKDLLDHLDGAREKPLRFLRYFILAHYEQDTKKPIREDEIYDWFTRNESLVGLDSQPLGFLKNMIDCAKAWANFLKGKDVDGAANTYLKNLTILSGASRQHFILLLAGRHLPAKAFDRLCLMLENLTFCYLITREPAKTLERNFLLWSSDIRAASSIEDLDRFIEQKIIPDLTKRRSSFDFAFGELRQSRIQRYRLRYILAKLTQYIEQQAWGNEAHRSLDQYIDSSVEVEHILPQTPTAAVRESFGDDERYDEYVEMLGNLTLLEKTINTSVSNDLYAKKLPGYAQSSYLLTKSLVEKPQVGVNTKLNRAVEHLIAFEAWDAASIERRQIMLSRLAVHVWDMPGERIALDAVVNREEA